MKSKKITLFDVVLSIILGLLALVLLIPFWQMIVVAFSTTEGYVRSTYHLIPTSFSVDVFSQLFSSSEITKGMLISLINVLCGWLGGLVLCSMGAYALTKKKIIGRKIIFNVIIFTMFFNGGIIPLYIWLRKINITDTIFCLFLPSLISTFYLLLLKNSFTTIPEEMEEAALIDGYNELQILFKIIIPVSKPVIAAVSLFLIVQYWNDYYNAMMFMNSPDLYPLGLILRNVIISKQTLLKTPVAAGTVLPSEQYNMALTIVAMVPILVLYPFVQKYFVAGVMIGAVKE